MLLVGAGVKWRRKTLLDIIRTSTTNSNSSL
jgi:hypothetical protein